MSDERTLTVRRWDAGRYYIVRDGEALTDFAGRVITYTTRPNAEAAIRKPSRIITASLSKDNQQ